MVFLEDDRKKIQVSIRNFKKKKKKLFPLEIQRLPIGQVFHDMELTA